MGTVSSFRKASLWAAAVGLWVIDAPIVRADMVPFDYSEDFNYFGEQVNLCPPTNPKGICAAVSAINSFIYLENQYPGVYGVKLTPNVVGPVGAETDAQDATAFGVTGWQVGTNPVRQGYYPRPGGANPDYIATLMDWVNDYAPGTSVFAAMYPGSGGLPDVAWLAQQIQSREDVEFFVSGPGFYHAATLTGIACGDYNYTDCSITYQDPNTPSVNQMTSIFIGTGGALQFTGLPGSSYTPTVSIVAAFSESPVPEPATLFLTGAVVIFLAGRRMRHR
ncbi:MAG: PEP-CTERM sorting domain-containing protein [Bryobacteraceae bacterium]|jgi:hypothetical protein